MSAVYKCGQNKIRFHEGRKCFHVLQNLPGDETPPPQNSTGSNPLFISTSKQSFCVLVLRHKRLNTTFKGLQGIGSSNSDADIHGKQ